MAAKAGFNAGNIELASHTESKPPGCENVSADGWYIKASFNVRVTNNNAGTWNEFLSLKYAITFTGLMRQM